MLLPAPTPAPSSPGVPSTVDLFTQAIALLERYPRERVIWRVIVNRAQELIFVTGAWTQELDALLTTRLERDVEFKEYVLTRLAPKPAPASRRAVA